MQTRMDGGALRLKLVLLGRLLLLLLIVVVLVLLRLLLVLLLLLGLTLLALLVLLLALLLLLGLMDLLLLLDLFHGLVASGLGLVERVGHDDVIEDGASLDLPQLEADRVAWVADLVHLLVVLEVRVVDHRGLPLAVILVVPVVRLGGVLIRDL